MFNYPNHPLFRITPLLDRGFNTVLHDEYTSHLVGRIRAGRYMPELWDCNSLYLDYGERLAAVRAPRPAFKSRYTMTMQEIRDYQNTPEAKAERARYAEERKARKERLVAAETALAARRREEAEERERYAREFAERIAARKAADEQRAREWDRVGAESQQYLTERAMIMGGSWECTRCLTPSEVTSQPAGRYAISCRRCGRHAVGDHVMLLAVMNARKTQPEPEIVGMRL